MRESDIQNSIRIALAPHGTFFRTNVGEAWIGPNAQKTIDGGIYIPGARRFSTGLPKGFSDLFGVLHLSGRAVFIEVKTDTGRIRPEQELFLSVMRERGAIAGICRSVDDALKLIGVIT